MQLYLGDCLDILKNVLDESIDLVLTSPPYDDLREYKGFAFNSKKTIGELFRVTKKGGVVVWIVSDATLDGSETGTSFRQALEFIEQGFNLHDTMIWNKGGFTAVGSLRSRYASVFEYMFVFSKGRPKTFNPIKDRLNKTSGRVMSGTVRQKDGSTRPMTGSGEKIIAQMGQRFNVWEIPSEKRRGEHSHPAVFPEALAKDHIESWSNRGDTVLDPFTGSGTTGIAAISTGRNFIGVEVSLEYWLIAHERISAAGA